MSIQEHLNKIRNAIKGSEVRESIAKGIETAYDDASEKHDNANMEVRLARGTNPNLNTRLNKMDETDRQNTEKIDSNYNEVTAQLAQTENNKVDKDGSQQVKWANIAQDAREQISGDKVAVVGKDSVGSENLTDNSVTFEKTDFADEVSIRAKNIQLNGNFSSDEDNDGIADGWGLGTSVTSYRVENNTQYWMPTGTYNSGSLTSRSWGWDEEAVAGHKYYVAFEQTNVGVFNIFSEPELFVNIRDDGKFSMLYTPPIDDRFDFRFRPRTANIESSVKGVLVVDLTKTFGVGNEPDLEHFEFILKVLGINGWFGGALNLIDARRNGVVTAKDLKLYDPEGLMDADNVNDALIELKKKLDSGSGFDPEPLHQLSLSDLENKRLNEELEVLKINSQKAFNIKMNKVSDRQEISLRKSTQQKLILHLHKRENDGYDTVNDVYLPNAEDDFSDIRITNDEGTVLPYRVTHYSDEYDILVDSRLGYGFPTSLILTDSNGKWFRTFDYINESVDEGKTWTEIPALSGFRRPVANIITHNDTLLFNHDGMVYRSEAPYTSYEQVLDLDPAGNYGAVNIVGKSMVQHPDGDLFLGVYQNEWHIRFYKSVDDGKTWQLSADFGDAYQHVHGMFVDVHVNPVAIYAGVDGGGGVYKTTDKGETWVDLREQNPDMPQSTDYGVRYSDPSGYRLLGGETPVVGGHSIIKTEDDINFRPVLSTGISVNYVEKMNGVLFATGSGDSSHDLGQVLVSFDEAESWETAYITTPYIAEASVNDGYRYMTKLDDQILVGSQGSLIPYLRIFPNGKYAEIVVDVPAGTDSVIVETGYAYSNVQPIYNDTKSIDEYLVDFNLNEGGNVIKESVSGKYFEGNFKWDEVGRHLSHFYPYITSPLDNLSLIPSELEGYKIDSSSFDVSEGITISFWAKLDEDIDINLFETDLGDVFKLVQSNAGLRTTLNNTYKAQVTRYILPEAFMKIDLVIGADGEVEAYNNGQVINIRKYNSLDVLNAIQNSQETTLLKTISNKDSHCIQHFSIRKGVVSEEQLLAEYNSYLSNNLF